MKKLLILSLISLVQPTAAYADGSQAVQPQTSVLIGDTIQTPDGTLWHISSQGKSAYPNMAVFNSFRFNSTTTIKKVNESAIKNLETKPDVAPQDGRVYCPSQGNNAGTCFFVSQGQKWAFANLEVLAGQGFTVPDTFNGSLDYLPTGGIIANAREAHKPGTFINSDGVVQLIGTDSRLNIPNLTIFYSWGYSFLDIVPANSEDLRLPERGELTLRKVGELNPLTRIPPRFGSMGESQISSSATTPTTTLISTIDQQTTPTVFGNMQILPTSAIVKTPNSPKVWYLTSKGYKKLIPSVKVLESYGNSLSQVETISQEVLDNYFIIPCITTFNSNSTYQLLPKGKKLLNMTEKASLCPFPEQVLEINILEFSNYPTKR